MIRDDCECTSDDAHDSRLCSSPCRRDNSAKVRRKINGGHDERYCDGRCWQRDDVEGSRDAAETVVGGGRHDGSMNHEDWFAHGETMEARWRCNRGTTEAGGGARVVEDGGHRPCECCHGAVVAAGRARRRCNREPSRWPDWFMASMGDVGGGRVMEREKDITAVWKRAAPGNTCPLPDDFTAAVLVLLIL
ncbi:hypothetical protein DEO72_LG10g2880 [Vigna unguiculata]|uniref:Uncharacterized protein n=1 Tax=Vigna unguiculata TaxID=3917 RepID=A0A4D6NHM6_VIGUN|nr:hypothetical protein DEO72_LG10g2880 [Vigna unguiculata]